MALLDHFVKECSKVNHTKTIYRQAQENTSCYTTGLQCLEWISQALLTLDRPLLEHLVLMWSLLWRSQALQIQVAQDPQHERL